MAPKPPVTPLTPEEYDEKCDSQVVTIYVGLARKTGTPFTLPKDLLGYYSRIFSYYFNGTSQHAHSGFLRLPADDPKLFAVLFDYIKNGSAVFPYDFNEMLQNGNRKFTIDPYLSLTNCISNLTSFLEVCSANDVPEAGSAIYKPLKTCLFLAQAYHLDSTSFLTDDFITTVLNIVPDLPDGNSVLSLLARSRVPAILAARPIIPVIVKENDRFAAEVLRQMLAMPEPELPSTISWLDIGLNIGGLNGEQPEDGNRAKEWEVDMVLG